MNFFVLKINFIESKKILYCAILLDILKIISPLAHQITYFLFIGNDIFCIMRWMLCQSHLDGNIVNFIAITVTSHPNFHLDGYRNKSIVKRK